MVGNQPRYSGEGVKLRAKVLLYIPTIDVGIYSYEMKYKLIISWRKIQSLVDMGLARIMPTDWE